MAVRLGRIDPERMVVSMVLIVDVPVVMRHRHVNVHVLVTVPDQQHHARRHRQRRDDVTRCPRLGEQWHREQRAGERRGREHRGLARARRAPASAYASSRMLIP